MPVSSSSQLWPPGGPVALHAVGCSRRRRCFGIQSTPLDVGAFWPFVCLLKWKFFSLLWAYPDRCWLVQSSLVRFLRVGSARVRNVMCSFARRQEIHLAAETKKQGDKKEGENCPCLRVRQPLTPKMRKIYPCRGISLPAGLRHTTYYK